ncbi:hypothetical protein [Streptomyces longwoodensis]|uniref:hypothetical protein n=1 Tax=Streptomyces longwoodensis TaxID=68231 RepID=UPI0036EE07E1
MVINTGQVVASVAGGALITIAIMYLLRSAAAERRADRLERQLDRQSKIDSAADLIMDGVEAFRESQTSAVADSRTREDVEAIEVRVKQHLRLISSPCAPRGLSHKPRPTRGRGSSRSRRRR